MSAPSTTRPTGHGVISQLLQDWDERLSVRTHDFGPLGTRSCQDVLLELRASESAEQDLLLHALLSLAAAGDQVSEDLVLYFMLPKASHFTRSCAALRMQPHADAAAAAVGAMWEAIRTYPLHRSSSVRGNLGLNALSIITRSLGAGLQKGSEEYPTADDMLEDALLRDGGVASLEPAWGDDSFHDLVTVLTWAADSGVLTRDEVSLLARCDLGDKAEREDLADQLGINFQSLTRRVHRVRSKLVEAVQAHIRANGSW